MHGLPGICPLVIYRSLLLSLQLPRSCDFECILLPHSLNFFFPNDVSISPSLFFDTARGVRAFALSLSLSIYMYTHTYIDCRGFYRLLKFLQCFSRSSFPNLTGQRTRCVQDFFDVFILFCQTCCLNYWRFSAIASLTDEFMGSF